MADIINHYHEGNASNKNQDKEQSREDQDSIVKLPQEKPGRQHVVTQISNYQSMEPKLKINPLKQYMANSTVRANKVQFDLSLNNTQKTRPGKNMLIISND